jgi:uncharacterized protein with PIN domain
VAGKDKFNAEEDHGKAFALLFDSHKIEDKFKHTTELPYFIVKDKEETRLSAMLHSASEIGKQFNHLQKSAICHVAIAKTVEEAAMVQIGLIKVNASGIAICPTCLARAILTCEENLAVLKDIQEATKVYAK